MEASNSPDPGRKQRITLEDVARDARVSRSTVSLVLRGSSAPSRTTQETVIRSIQKLGYVYNRTAANLRTRTTHTIGLIMPNIENRFFAQLTVGVEAEFDQSNKIVMLANTSENLLRQRKAIAMMLEHNVDGVLICPVPGSRAEDVQPLFGGVTPAVSYVRRVTGVPCRFVANDNVGGATIAVDHLLRLGHTRIGFVGGYPDTSAYHERLSGFKNALRRAGVPLQRRYVFPGENSFNGGCQVAARVAGMHSRPTAVFCFNDMTALGFMRGVDNAGLISGRDMAVVGFDDIQEAAMWQPPLSTVSCEPETVGREAARLLMRVIEGRSPDGEEVLLPVELIERSSSAGYSGAYSRGWLSSSVW